MTVLLKRIAGVFRGAGEIAAEPDEVSFTAFRKHRTLQGGALPPSKSSETIDDRVGVSADRQPSGILHRTYYATTYFIGTTVMQSSNSSCGAGTLFR